MSQPSDKPHMNWSADYMPETFNLFKQRFELYFLISELLKKQVRHIFYFCGEEGLRRYNSWRLSNADKTKPDFVWSKFSQQIVKPTENSRVSCLKMQKITQKDDECIDDYVSSLKLQAYKCDLRDDDDINTRVIEQIIAGTRHSELQKDLLQKPKSLTLDEALDMGRAEEASLLHMKDLSELKVQASASSDVTVSVNAVRHKNCNRCGGKPHVKLSNAQRWAVCATHVRNKIIGPMYV